MHELPNCSISRALVPIQPSIYAGHTPLYTVVLYHTILCFTTSRPAASRVSEHRQASTRSSTADNHYRYGWHLAGGHHSRSAETRREYLHRVKLTRPVSFATIGSRLPVSALESGAPPCCQGIWEGGMAHGSELATGSPGLSRLASDRRRQTDCCTPYSAVAHRDACAALSSPTRVAHRAAAVVPAARQFLPGATVWHGGTARTCGDWDESV